MIRRTILTAVLMAAGAAMASAQEPRVELSATAGWTSSCGTASGRQT